MDPMDEEHGRTKMGWEEMQTKFDTTRKGYAIGPGGNL